MRALQSATTSCGQSNVSQKKSQNGTKGETVSFPKFQHSLGRHKAMARLRGRLGLAGAPSGAARDEGSTDSEAEDEPSTDDQPGIPANRARPPKTPRPPARASPGHLVACGHACLYGALDATRCPYFLSSTMRSADSSPRNRSDPVNLNPRPHFHACGSGMGSICVSVDSLRIASDVCRGERVAGGPPFLGTRRAASGGRISRPGRARPQPH